ncbi:hypothetical protein [Halomonas sp. MMSF_3323]|uniref:hypothetical protein n=1 Tax=Halomonas sp. MMSF_3323 TaxID=3046701 RepID=UPI00273D1E99|nr:hypothetical protein [Halomonas sp. MMSF_3323]
MFIQHHNNTVLIAAVVYIFAALMVIFSTSFSPAFAQDPSPEQCTCDLQGFNEKTGAEVVNAGSCVLSLKHPWCDIFLASIEDSEDHATIIAELSRADDFGSLEVALLSLFDRFVEAVGRDDPGLASEHAENAYTIVSLLEESIDQFSYCLDSFKYGESVIESTDLTSCAVGSQSGWLNLEFIVDDYRYLFLFAPQE